MADDLFSPKTLSVNVGDTVVWTNSGAMAHTVTADNASFVSTTLQPGQTYSHTFTSAGSFAYHCQFHGASGGVGMSGTIVVSAPSATPASGASSGSTTSGGSQSTGTSGTSQTVAELQAQVQALSKSVALLQQQKPTSTSAPASCSAIAPTLKQGSSGAAVTQLQQFLARDPSVYPEGLVTGYFGSLTQAAVQRFQAKNGIVSSGSPSTTGYGQVGPKTAAVILAQCGGGSAASAAPVGGFIQVSPDSGKAPLQINVLATVNTTNACGTALYTLDFGDGTQQQQMNVPAGTCQSLQQTYTHTYSTVGSYQVTLAAGDHSSSAVVVVQ